MVNPRARFRVSVAAGAKGMASFSVKSWLGLRLALGLGSALGLRLGLVLALGLG